MEAPTFRLQNLDSKFLPASKNQKKMILLAYSGRASDPPPYPLADMSAGRSSSSERGKSRGGDELAATVCAGSLERLRGLRCRSGPSGGCNAREGGLLTQRKSFSVRVQVPYDEGTLIKISLSHHSVIPASASAFLALARSGLRVGKPFPPAGIAFPVQRHLRNQTHQPPSKVTIIESVCSSREMRSTGFACRAELAASTQANELLGTCSQTGRGGQESAGCATIRFPTL